MGVVKSMTQGTTGCAFGSPGLLPAAAFSHSRYSRLVISPRCQAFTFSSQVSWRGKGRGGHEGGESSTHKAWRGGAQIRYTRDGVKAPWVMPCMCRNETACWTFRRRTIRKTTS